MSAAQPPATASARTHIVMVGVEGSGKTALSVRLVQDTFTVPYNATVGIDHFTITHATSPDNVDAVTLITDCGGRPLYAQLTREQMTHADAVLVVFDLSVSALHDYRDLVDSMRRAADDTAPIILVGTHVDLLPQVIDGREEAIVHTMRRHNIIDDVEACAYAGRVYAVSSKTGEGIDELREALELIRKTRPAYQSAANAAADANAQRFVEQRDARGGSTGTLDTTRLSASAGASDSTRGRSDQYLVSSVAARGLDMPLTVPRGMLAAARANAIAQRKDAPPPPPRK